MKVTIETTIEKYLNTYGAPQARKNFSKFTYEEKEKLERMFEDEDVNEEDIDIAFWLDINYYIELLEIDENEFWNR